MQPQFNPEELYQNGIADFERGNYQKAVQKLEQARLLVPLQTPLGGQIQVWLANAYEALGNSEQALALCRGLVKHPDQDVRKSAKYVLRILSAPQLRPPQGKNSTIPSLKDLDKSDRSSIGTSRKFTNSPKQPKATWEEPPPPTTTDNSQFVWITLAIALLSMSFYFFQ